MTFQLLFTLGLFASPPLSLQQSEPSSTFSVEHDHLFGSGKGRLTLGPEGVLFDAEDEEHQREWPWADIRQVTILSPTRLEVLTYEDVWWKLGRDQRFAFRITDGELTPEVVELVRRALPASTVSTIFSEPDDAFYCVGAKHRHNFGGGCEGELFFTDRGVHFSSSKPDHSRYWPLETIQSLGRQSDLSFRLSVREDNLLGETRNFQFQLKRALDEKAYERLWRRIHEPASWLGLMDKVDRQLESTLRRLQRLESPATEVGDSPDGDPSGPLEPAVVFGFETSAEPHPSVLRFLDFFEHRRARWLVEGARRQTAFRDLVEPILHERGLPQQLVFLPLLESFYDPRAVSHAGAAGLWQLMPETARRYGLRVEAAVDERMDPVRSSRAAAAYLEDLFERFADWPLALSAYNAGEGRIERLLEETGTSGFWELAETRRLPSETRDFVPAYLALVKLLSPPRARTAEAARPADRRKTSR